MSRLSKKDVADKLAVVKEIRSLEKQEKGLFQKRLNLINKFHKSLGDLILETKALANYSWSASITKFWLHSELSQVKDNKLIQFKDFCYEDSSAHLNATFWDEKVSLRVYDNHVDLNFKDSQTMSKFVLENRLIVDTTRLEKVIEELQDDINGYLEIERALPEA